MKSKITGWIVGGLITVSVLGVTYGVSNAAKAEPAQNTMIQHEQMNSDMMNSKDMQKQCGEMMKSSEMQKNMKDMMKQMISKDPEMKQIMIDMMKSADDNSTRKPE